MSETNKRNFAFRDGDGNESSVFSGTTPREAALKASRRLPSGESEDQADRVTIRLRERGTDDVYVFEAWAWDVASDKNDPDWVGDTVTESEVSKLRVDRVDDN